jgi:hypothetical protein
MSKDGITAFKNVSMASLYDPRKHEDVLNDLWFEWVKLSLELQLGNAVRRRFPGHSEDGTYGRLARCIDELGFVASDVRFHAETLRRALVARGHNIMAAVLRWGKCRAWAQGASHRMTAAVTRILAHVAECHRRADRLLSRGNHARKLNAPKLERDVRPSTPCVVTGGMRSPVQRSRSASLPTWMARERPSPAALRWSQN